LDRDFLLYPTFICWSRCSEPVQAASHLHIFHLEFARSHGGSIWKFSTSDRLTRALPAIICRFSRPRFTNSEIAWRLTPLTRAASLCEIHSARFEAALQSFFFPLGIVNLSATLFSA
jgi:hypothetical protein